MKRLFLHIGKHKTGSTAFQQVLAHTREDLQRLGVCVLPGAISHQLAAATIRDHLPIPPLIDARYFQQDISIEKLAADVSAFLKDKTYTTLIVSSEHLSYLRTPAEVGRLRQILPPEHQLSVFLVLREREDFRKSYLRQTVKTGHGPSDDKTSPYYCGKDSWLLDDDKIIELWNRECEELKILNYSNKGMVRSLLACMGLPQNLVEEEVWSNSTPSRLARFMTWSKRSARRNSPYAYYLAAGVWGKSKDLLMRRRLQ